MEAVEIAVFIGIAVMVGAMIVGFVIDWDTNKTQDDIQNIIFKENEVGYKKLNRDQFTVELYNVWQDCGFGELNKTTAMYVTKTIADEDEDEELTKEIIFDGIKKLNWCLSLQSDDEDCGEGEDVVMDDDITLPAIVRVECFENELLIS